MESLEGRKGQPRKRPPFPAVAGLWRQPTIINNVETMTQVPVHRRARASTLQEHRHREEHRQRPSSA